MKSLLFFKNHSSYFDDNKCFVRYNNKSIELIGYDEKIMLSLKDNLLPVVEFIDFHHYDGEALCKIYCKHTDEKINIPVFNHWSEVYKKTDTDFINGERVYRYEDDNGFILYLEDSKNLCIYEKVEKCMYIISLSNENHKVFHHNIHRIIRNIFFENLLIRGYYPLHAAGVIINDKLSIICGEKGKGKTTLMFNLLVTKHAKFVANDTLFIQFDKISKKFKCMPFPEAIPVGKGTLQMISEFYNNKKIKTIIEKLGNIKSKYMFSSESFYNIFEFVNSVNKRKEYEAVVLTPDIEIKKHSIELVENVDTMKSEIIKKNILLDIKSQASMGWVKFYGKPLINLCQNLDEFIKLLMKNTNSYTVLGFSTFIDR